MGNSSRVQKGKQKLAEYKIPQNYYQNCHPNLLDLNIDQKQRYVLSGFILIDSGTYKWREKIQPLLSTKYILIPCRILTDNYFFEQGCLSSQLPDAVYRLNVIEAYIDQLAYEPYVYSLNRQITARKQQNRNFSQQQLWKIIKYLTRALIQWHNIFPFQTIASIMPENVVINYKGNIRIVTQYSFPKDSYFHKARPLYMSPQNKTNSVIKYTKIQPNKYKILSTDLYAIGMTVLDCLLLERSQQPSFSTLSQKLNHLYTNYEQKYTRQLKDIIQTLLNEDYKKRPSPYDLVNLAQQNQTKFF